MLFGHFDYAVIVSLKLFSPIIRSSQSVLQSDGLPIQCFALLVLSLRLSSIVFLHLVILSFRSRHSFFSFFSSSPRFFFFSSFFRLIYLTRSSHSCLSSFVFFSFSFSFFFLSSRSPHSFFFVVIIISSHSYCRSQSHNHCDSPNHSYSYNST